MPELDEEGFLILKRTSLITDDILKSLDSKNASALEGISGMIGAICSISISMKKTKKDMVALLAILIDQIPADEFDLAGKDD